MIITKDLVKIYRGGVKALDRVNIRTPSEGIISFVGSNGAGKTTLMRILAGVLKPTSGYVEVAGVDVVREPQKIRERTSYMPQGSTPPGFSTPYQFITSYLMYRGFSYKEAREKALEVIRLFELENIMMRRCSELSYGTQQRVIASAVIASDADIMILDEPTSGLDPIARRRFWAALYSLKRKGKMILITSHNPEEIESISDYIIVMSRGNIVAQGDLKSLLRSIEFKRVIEIYSEDSFINIYEEKLKTDTVYRLRNMIVSYYKDEDQADKIVDQLSRDGLKIRIRPVSVTDLLLLRGEYLYEETD